jgi:hypothetical protein
MELKAALALAQLLSLIVFIAIAKWYVVPWLKTLDRHTALTVLVWPHVFRYVALQAYSVQHAGFPISEDGLRRIVYGDVGGMVIAFAAIVALRRRWRAAMPLVWLLVVTTVIDTITNISGGIRENLFGAATGVTWMVVSFYVPFLMVSLGLTVWQLFARRGERIEATAAEAPRLVKRVPLAG